MKKRITKLAFVLTIALFVSISFLPISAQISRENKTTDNPASINNTQLENINDVSTAKVLGQKSNFNPQITTNLSSSFGTVDVREYVLNEYFRARNSPLTGMAHLFVDACDRYGAPRDCITVVAIARHETDLCNYYGSAEMKNCLGWGGGGQYRKTFSSYYEMVDTATNVLVNQYGRRYMINPILMENVFCGPQEECEGWGTRILFFMEEIDRFSESLGFGRLTLLR